MCSKNGITASIAFEKPFSGKIFSINYSNTHECIYYNGGTFIDNPLLFTIPINGCGTRITKNTRNIIDSMENQIYVQMNKYSKTIFDHQYSFICELALDPILSESFGTQQKGLSIDGDPDSDIPRPELLLNYRNLQFPLPHKEPMLPKYIKPIIVDEISKSIDELNKENNNFDEGKRKLLSDTFKKLVDENLKEANNFVFNSKKSQEYRKIENGFLVNDVSSTVGTTASEVSSESPLTTTQKSSTAKRRDMKLKTTVHHLNDNSIIKPAKEVEERKINESEIALPTTNLVANQTIDVNKKFTDILLEIQKGEGPYNDTVNTPLRLGDVLTLVIKGKASKTPTQYNMFVHSCYASGSSKGDRVPLIDKDGCPINNQIIGKLQRTKNTYGDTLYYFKMRTFKFPGNDNVFFSCSVETSTNTYPEICPKGDDKMNRLKRTLNKNDDKNRNTFVVFDNIKVEDDNSTTDNEKANRSKDNLQSSSTNILSNYYILIPLILLPLLLICCCCLCLRCYCKNMEKSPNKPSRIISTPIPKVPSAQHFASERNSNSLPVFSFDKIGKRKMSIFTEASS
uniref:ZP domain-containing protein n=1 Tax=Strongyloides papillosus TaxID=174720 RepID=A0A0N5BHU8_STREA